MVQSNYRMRPPDLRPLRHVDLTIEDDTITSPLTPEVQPLHLSTNHYGATEPRIDVIIPFQNGTASKHSSTTTDDSHSDTDVDSDKHIAIAAGNAIDTDETDAISSTSSDHAQRFAEIAATARDRFHAQRAALAQSTSSTSTTTSARERTRDWSVGPITGHRVIVLGCLAVFYLAVYELQDWLWPFKQPSVGMKRIFANFSVIWLTVFVPSVLGLIGAVLFRHNDRLDDLQPIDHFVAWRIVSRGTNREALAATVRRVQEEMAKTPLFPYIIETVTDVPAQLPPSEDLVCITVPDSYMPPRKSKFKARALHYALQESPLPGEAWLVHLDEETQPTPSGVKGIAAMVAEEEASGRLRIGQGALLYHRSWREHPFLTLADNMRTGDDLARFYLQHVFGVTIFGLHGSYIVCRNDVERRVGFDFGPVGSITEDAFWALKCMQDGSRSRWVDGYLEEQSTQSVVDFIKQRRRWYHGLVLVSLYAPVRWEYRASLFVNTVLWAMTPMGTVYTVANLFVGGTTNEVVRILADFSLAFYVMLYVVGAMANMDEQGTWSWGETVKWYVLQVVLVPVFSMVEASAVVYALVKPETGFHVVKK